MKVWFIPAPAPWASTRRHAALEGNNSRPETSSLSRTRNRRLRTSFIGGSLRGIIQIGCELNLVPERGLEPPLPCENQVLNLARLPIPPFGHMYHAWIAIQRLLHWSSARVMRLFSFCPPTPPLSTKRGGIKSCILREVRCTFCVLQAVNKEQSRMFRPRRYARWED